MRFTILIAATSAALSGCVHSRKVEQASAPALPPATWGAQSTARPQAFATIPATSWVLGRLAARREDPIASVLAAGPGAQPIAAPVTPSYRAVSAPPMDPAQFNPNRIR